MECIIADAVYFPACWLFWTIEMCCTFMWMWKQELLTNVCNWLVLCVCKEIIILTCTSVYHLFLLGCSCYSFKYFLKQNLWLKTATKQQQSSHRAATEQQHNSNRAATEQQQSSNRAATKQQSQYYALAATRGQPKWEFARTFPHLLTLLLQFPSTAIICACDAYVHKYIICMKCTFMCIDYLPTW